MLSRVKMGKFSTTRYGGKEKTKPLRLRRLGLKNEVNGKERAYEEESGSAEPASASNLFANHRKPRWNFCC